MHGVVLGDGAEEIICMGLEGMTIVCGDGVVYPMFDRVVVTYITLKFVPPMV
jgi:hypothetical protein